VDEKITVSVQYGVTEEQLKEAFIEAINKPPYWLRCPYCGEVSEAPYICNECGEWHLKARHERF